MLFLTQDDCQDDSRPKLAHFLLVIIKEYVWVVVNHMPRRTLAVIVGLVIFMVLAVWISRRPGSTLPALRTVPVKSGDVVATIGATGTVEPEEVVDVGAQVAGMIKGFGTDVKGKAIDYGSEVDNGTILAQIDDSLYAADVAQSRAQLQQNRAAVLQSQSNVLQARAKLADAQRDWERAEKLGPSEALAPTSYDAYKANFEVAKSNLAAAEAAVEQAKAAVALSQAALQRAERNLSYCTIKSPVRGVIIDRRVNVGQTVVSSLNAPSLFLIARDLRRIEVWVSVNEADIGNIHPSEPVTFTVDAFPGQTFRGQVGKVRLNATMTQNVVTYTVVVSTDNSDGRLLPYLTANAQFEIGRRQNVLTVPNAALRWWPLPGQVASSFRKEFAAMAQPPLPAGLLGGVQGQPKQAGIVWVREGEYVRPQSVSIGLTDGMITEISGPGLKEGMDVVVGEQLAGAPAGASSGQSPFTPQFRRSQRGTSTSQPPAGAQPKPKQ
jgi:HlyD family secretion protein